MGLLEILLIFIVSLVVLGPKQIPTALRHARTLYFQIQNTIQRLKAIFTQQSPTADWLESSTNNNQSASQSETNHEQQ